MNQLPNISSSVTRGQMFAVGADSDASYTVAAVVGRVAFIGRSAGGQILVLQECQILIDVKRLQQILMTVIKTCSEKESQSRRRRDGWQTRNYFLKITKKIKRNDNALKMDYSFFWRRILNL
jgi:hypothetical protein